MLLNQSDLRILKNTINISARCLEMLKIAVWKKWRNQRMRFLGYMFAKNRYINLKLDMPDIQASFYNIHSGFPKCQKFWVLEKLRKEIIFILWLKNLFGKNRESHLKERFVLRLLMSFIYILFQILLWHFQTFINFRPKTAWYWVT